MLGTVVNALAIVAGGLVGLCCTRGIDDRFRQTVLQGLALCVLLIGAKSALAADNLLVVILSLVVGGVVGVPLVSAALAPVDLPLTAPARVRVAAASSLPVRRSALPDIAGSTATTPLVSWASPQPLVQPVPPLAPLMAAPVV